MLAPETPALFTVFLGLFSSHERDNGPSIVAARRADALALIGSYFDGATFHDAVGMWKGATEPTLVVSILGTGADSIKARKMSAHLARAFSQDAVALSVAPLASIDYVSPRD
jgi:hypothetical protein